MAGKYGQSRIVAYYHLVPAWRSRFAEQTLKRYSRGISRDPVRPWPFPRGEAARRRFRRWRPPSPAGLPRPRRVLADTGRSCSGPRLYATQRSHSLASSLSLTAHTPHAKLPARALLVRIQRQGAHSAARRAFLNPPFTLNFPFDIPGPNGTFSLIGVE